MPYLLKAMLWSAVVFLLPWLGASVIGRRDLAIVLGVVWLAGYACAILLWFGVGVTLIALTGLCAALLVDCLPSRRGSNTD